MDGGPGKHREGRGRDAPMGVTQRQAKGGPNARGGEGREKGGGGTQRPVGGRPERGQGRLEGSTDGRLRGRWREGQKDRATGAGSGCRCPQTPGTEREPGGGPPQAN